MTRIALGLLALLIGSPAAGQAVRPPGPPLASSALELRPPVTRRVAGADSLRPPDLWTGRDKAMHASASFLLTLSGQYVLTDKAGLTDGQALPVSAATTLALGVLKEVADSRRAVGPHFSWRDLAADAVGVALGALVAAW